VGTTSSPGNQGTRVALLIVAAIRFYREGLALFFHARDGFEVAGTAADVASTVDLVDRVEFDVALLDMATPAAPTAIALLRAVAPGRAIVALGVREDEDEVIPLAEAGVDGFVSRDASLEELCLAVRSAAEGETQCSPRVAAMLAHRVATLARQLPDRAPIPLTRRQLEIVKLIDEGLPNKAIAQRLFIEVPTVKNHVHNILQRLDVKHRQDAALAVRRLSQGVLPS